MADLDAIDIDATTDIDPSFRAVTRQTAIAQAVARRLLTPTDGHPWDEEYGLGVTRWLNAGGDPRYVESRVAALSEHQALLDERVHDARAEVVFTEETSTLEIKLHLTDETDTDFDLTLEVSDVTSTVLYE